MLDDEGHSFLDVIFASPLSNEFKEEKYIDGLVARGTFVPEMAHRSADGCATFKNRVSFVNALQSVYRVGPSTKNRNPMSSVENKNDSHLPLRKNMSWDSSSYFKQQERENEKENSWLMGSIGSNEEGVTFQKKEEKFDYKTFEELEMIVKEESEVWSEVSEFNLPPQKHLSKPEVMEQSEVVKTTMKEMIAVETYSYDD